MPSLASQKATTCCPLAIVAEGRSATFSSRALHLRITARRISIRLLSDLNLFIVILQHPAGHAVLPTLCLSTRCMLDSHCV